MDQSAFRSLLQGQASSSAANSRPRPAASHHGALGGSRQRLGIGGGSTRRDQGIPDVAPPKNSLEQFRPRQQKSSVDKGKAKAVDQDKASEPSFKKYGYADRASKRRAGLDEAEDEAGQEERRPRGLDFSKLDPDKRALLGIEPEEIPLEEPKEEVLPLKTDEEVERELAEAEAKLRVEKDSTDTTEARGRNDPEHDSQPAPKKQKRSRAEMLRDLQAKIAAASSAATEVKLVEPTGSSGRKEKQTTAASEPAVMKGFRAIERAPEKKKKKRRLQVGDIAEPSTSASRQDTDTRPAESLLGTLNGIESASAAVDEDDDIFGGAGEYDDGLSAEDDSGEEGENKKTADKTEAGSAGPIKYFDDQDDIIPKFETWRTPTPPPRRGSGSPQRRQSGDEEDDRVHKPQRLEGFSTSQYSARELLERDNALAREEKRKLRKLKGKDKKEAMERLAELDGTRTAEQKEADRLNRDAQEYENYERKKQKRERPEKD